MEKRNNIERLPSRLSVYIDFLRIVASLLVMVSHYPLSIGMFGLLSRTNFAYDAVVVFFVLSGYVISYAAEALEGSARRFAVNRVARIFPVAVVAVLLSALLLYIVGSGRPDLYGPIPDLSLWPEIALRSIIFTNQVWFSNITPFVNGPYWSLSFEVWCYVFYGVFIFSKGGFRWAVLVGLALLLGPKHVIMLPMWLAGSFAYHMRNRLHLSKPMAIFMATAPVFAYFAIQAPMPRDWSYAYVGSKVEAVLGFGLDGAANFGWGYVLALLFAVHLFAIGILCKSERAGSSSKVVGVIRFLSSYTFSLYILHGPIIKFVMAVFEIDRNDYNLLLRLAVYAVVFLAVYFIGNLVEHRKHLFRKWVNSAFDSVFQVSHLRTKE